MEKTILIDGREVRFKATANTPRLYRLKFRRDMLQDMAKLANQYSKGKIDIPELTVFENVAYIMALQADAQIGEVSDWLDDFRIFDIYEVLPQLLELWGMNMETTIESKKNKRRVAGR